MGFSKKNTVKQILVLSFALLWNACGSTKSGYDNESGATPAKGAANSAGTAPATTPQGDGVVSPAVVPGPAATPAAPTVTVAAKVTYSGQIQAFIVTNCSSCHGTGSSLGDWSTFDKAKAASSRMNARIQNGSMPQGRPLPADQRKLFQDWVSGGAPQT